MAHFQPEGERSEAMKREEVSKLRESSCTERVFYAVAVPGREQTLGTVRGGLGGDRFPVLRARHLFHSGDGADVSLPISLACFAS